MNCTSYKIGRVLLIAGASLGLTEFILLFTDRLVLGLVLIGREVADVPIMNERIKEMRLKRNLTLLEVAEHIGVKEATAQRYESGSIKNIKHETICQLAELFRCDPTYLMGWTDDRQCLASGIQNSAVVQGNNAETLIVRNGGTKERELSEDEAELLRIFSLLDSRSRHKLMQLAFDLEEKT